MSKSISTVEELATASGVAILIASTNANIVQTGGMWNYASSHAGIVAALSLGVFAGARVIGSGKASKVIGLMIAGALFCGEAYNFSATGERIVVERENGAAPLKAKQVKHDEAEKRLYDIEHGKISSPRLETANAEKTKADAAYDKELREGGRCKTICLGLKDKAEAAQREVVAALSEAEHMHQADIDAAKADVKANPTPASATPLSDRTGIPAWLLDLGVAGLLSFAANALAAVLIGFGARNSTNENSSNDDAAQSDFDPTLADNIVRFYRPDNGGPNNRPDRPGPKKPGPTGPIGLSKGQALDDLMQRLADGRTIGSQDELAADWNRPKQTVSDWLREWRRIGVIPAPVKTGRCKSLIAG